MGILFCYSVACSVILLLVLYIMLILLILLILYPVMDVTLTCNSRISRIREIGFFIAFCGYERVISGLSTSMEWAYRWAQRQREM